MGLMMIPDTARTYPDLSCSVSKPSYNLDNFIFSSLDTFLDDIEDFSALLHSDQPIHIDEDLLPSSLDADFYESALNDDQYLYSNLHEEPYQEKRNAAAIEAAAFKSCSVLFSPELLHIVNPNEVFPDYKNEVKIKVTDEFVLNNTKNKGGKHVFVKGEKEVHNDHSYFKEEVVVKVEIKEEEVDDDDYDDEEEEEEFEQKHVVVKVEAPVAKRPVGRPRKTPIASKPMKRPAAHFYEETNEEFVDVESIDIKRPRKASKVKVAKASAKKATKRKVPKPSLSGEESCSPTHFQAIDPLNPNGYVMRQAKTSALKKITKTKKGQTAAVCRSKRSDHNDMERRRRHEMRDLFEELKVLVPTELLVDDNNKIKKNPSKNTILVGSRKYIDISYGHKTTKNSLVRQNQMVLLKRRYKLEKSLRKKSKKLISRRHVIC